MGTVLLVISSLVWGVIHSLLASFKAKEVAQRWFGASANRWYRFAYNVFAGVSFLPVLFLAAILPDSPLYAVPAPWNFVMMAGQAASALMLVVGVLQTDTLSFIGISQLFGIESNSKLTVRGLYRYVRHPLYTAGLLFLWLTPAMTVNSLVLYAILTIYILIGAYFEERKLLREFGSEYEAYKAKTPMLIPFLQPLIKPQEQ